MTEVEKYKEVNDGYQFFKAHRKSTGWDSNAQKSLRYYLGDQWESALKMQMKMENRAASVFNMILPAIDLIIGHYIETRADIVGKAVDRVADPYIARFITQGIKNIEQSNNVVYERKAQFIDGLITGVGIKEKYWEEHLLKGKLIVQQKDSGNYYLDPNFRKYDYSDATRLYKDSWLTKKQVERIYGKKIAEELPFIEIGTTDRVYPINSTEKGYNENTDYGNIGGSVSETTDDALLKRGYDEKGKLYKAVEEYEKVWEEIEYYFNPDLKDGEGDWEKTELLTDEEKETVKNQTVKMTEAHLVLKTILAEKLIQEIDLEQTEFNQLFDFFFPYFINGKYMGIIENLWYPQDEINKRHSSIVHILTTIGSNQIFFTGEFMGDVGEQDMNTNLAKTGKNIKVGKLYGRDGKPTFFERKPATVPPIFEHIIGTEKEDIKYIPGATDPMAGKSERRESGKAKNIDLVRASQRLSVFIDNFKHTKIMEGKSYIWWIQNKYTEEKVIRIYGETLGETDQEITMNKHALGKLFNDVTIGEYDCVIGFEGQTPTERERTFWKLHEMAQNNPQFADIIGKQALKMSELPEKDIILAEWEERQRMIQQQNMMGMAQQGQPNRGPTQSAPRPSRGPTREPARIRQ